MIHPGLGKTFANYKQALEFITADPITPLYVYGSVLKTLPNSVPRETLREVVNAAQIRIQDRLMFLVWSGDLPEYAGVGKQQIEEVYELTQSGDWVQNLNVFEQFLERTSNLLFGDYKRPNWLEYLISGSDSK